MSWLSRKQAGAFALASAALIWSSVSHAEIKLGEANGWTMTTDGRINGFVSHVWGDDRPDGLENLPWVGFNESGNPAQVDADGKLRRTRVRSGYVPSTLGFKVHKQADTGLELTGRIEIGMQIANVDPTFVANPTWMDPRSVYLDFAGDWGSVRAGRDFGLFSRGNLFMNFELGHAYGVGFPCAYEKVFGGACGHVGFGTLWPDFHAQITYSTPKIGDVFQLSVGVFDPRTVPTYSWVQTPLPRFETEAVFDYSWDEGWGVKAWGNGAYQEVGIGVDVIDMTTFQPVGREEFSQTALGYGGGVIGYLGPVKLGVSGYAGEGMDGFEFLGFNPIFVGQSSAVANEDRRFRPTNGILVEGSLTFGDTWVMGGFGKASLDRVDTDTPIDTVDAFPLLRGQRGISAGAFHRIGDIVIGLDYFNALYSFDPNLVSQDDGSAPRFVEVEQNVQIINTGLTLEW